MNINSHKIAVAVLLCGALVSVTLANGGDTNKPARPTSSGAGAATGYIEKFEVPERDDNGNLKWKFTTGAILAINSSPAIGADGTVYFGSGNLYAVGAAAGSRVATTCRPL